MPTISTYRKSGRLFILRVIVILRQVLMCACQLEARRAKLVPEDRKYVHHENRRFELRFLFRDCSAGGTGVLPHHLVEGQLRRLLHLVGMGCMVGCSVASIDQSGISVGLGRDSRKALTPLIRGSMSVIDSMTMSAPGPE